MIDDKLLVLDHTNGKWCLDGVPFDGVSKYATGTLRWHKDGIYHREDGPAVEYAGGKKEWRIHGKYHREDGPAIEYANGTKAWWVHGNCHREDGPAIERTEGTNEWFIHNKRIHTWKEYHVLSTLSPQEQMVVKLRYGEQLK